MHLGLEKKRNVHKIYFSASVLEADPPLQDALLDLRPLQERDQPDPAGRGRQVALVALTQRHASRESI